MIIYIQKTKMKLLWKCQCIQADDFLFFNLSRFYWTKFVECHPTSKLPWQFLLFSLFFIQNDSSLELKMIFLYTACWTNIQPLLPESILIPTIVLLLNLQFLYVIKSCILFNSKIKHNHKDFYYFCIESQSALSKKLS